jgi:beta-hydroxylase
LFDVDSNRAFWATSSFPWISPIEANWGAIRAEFDRVLVERERIPGLGDLSEDANLTFDRKPLSASSEWKWFFLHAYGNKIEANCLRCPTTAKLVESTPGMQSAVFVVLAPGKHIAPHRGLYKGLIRYHLGVLIPKPTGLCRIRVADETRPWEEGRSLVFDDTLTHEVWNDSDIHRVVLIMDIERPLPFPLAPLNRMVLRWISTTRYITDAIRKAAVPEGGGVYPSDATAKIGELF